MFDVKLVQLLKDLGWDRKNGVGVVSCYGAMVDRVCKWHQNNFNLMSSLTFFIIRICFQYI